MGVSKDNTEQANYCCIHQVAHKNWSNNKEFNLNYKASYSYFLCNQQNSILNVFKDL